MFTIQKPIFIVHMGIAAMGLVSSAHLLLTKVVPSRLLALHISNNSESYLKLSPNSTQLTSRACMHFSGPIVKLRTTSHVYDNNNHQWMNIHILPLLWSIFKILPRVKFQICSYKCFCTQSKSAKWVRELQKHVSRFCTGKNRTEHI